MSEKIYVKITGDFQHKAFVRAQINVIKNFCNNIIFSVSDCPGCFKWNGGHNVDINIKCTPEKFIKHIKKYNEDEIDYSVIFNNTVLTEEDLKDEDCNKILNFLNDCEYKTNSVTVGSEILYQYIKKKYPNIKIQCSATKQLYTQEDIEKEKQSHDYCRIVLAADASHKPEILEKIKNKEEIELIIDEMCAPDCPFKKEHYEATSRWMLTHDPSIDINCRMKGKYNKNIMCSPEKVQELYNMGFRHFKLTHREFPENIFQHWLKIYINILKGINLK